MCDPSGDAGRLVEGWSRSPQVCDQRLPEYDLADGVPGGVDGAPADAAAHGGFVDDLCLGELAVEVGLQYVGVLLYAFLEGDVALQSLDFDCHSREMFFLHGAKLLPFPHMSNSCPGLRTALSRILWFVTVSRWFGSGMQSSLSRPVPDPEN